MQSNELEQVTSDLSTIRQAMRLDKAYAMDDVTRALVIALSSLLAFLLLMFTQWNNLVIFNLSLVPWMLYYFRTATQRHRGQAERPGLWLEDKLMLKALAVIMPFLIGWLAWSRFTGSIDIKSAGASVVFFVGVVVGYIGIVDFNRRRYLADSIVAMAFGLAIPSLTHHQTLLSGTAALMVGGVGEAAIVLWQLKHDRGSSTGAKEIA